MPRRVEQFVPWRLYWYVYQRLLLIQRANGYNNDAAVYLTLEEYRNSSDRAAVFMFTDAGGADTQDLGGGDGSKRIQERVQFQIFGSVEYGSGMGVREAMSLEQDVRTAIQTGVASARASVGTGVALTWGECSRQYTALSGEKQAGFTLSCSISWPQGSTW